MNSIKNVCVISILSLFVASGFAAELKVCDMFARPGTQDIAHVAVFNVFDMAGGDVELSFDSTVLTPKSVSLGALLVSSPHEFLIASNLDPCPPGEDCPPPTPGVARFSFASAQGINASYGEIALVAFEASSSTVDGESTQVMFTLSRLYDSVPEPFPVDIRPGKIYFTSGLAVGASTDKVSYESGDTVRISVFAFNPFKSPRQADFYFAILFPDGSLRYLPTLSIDSQEGRIGFTMASATSYPETPLWELKAGEAMPAGAYTLYAGMAEPGTMNLIAPLWTASFWVKSGQS